MSLKPEDFELGELVEETDAKGPLGLTLKIHLEPEDARELLARASREGKRVTSLAVEILQAALKSDSNP
jgi:hypothetical protein